MKIATYFDNEFIGYAADVDRARTVKFKAKGGESRHFYQREDVSIYGEHECEFLVHGWIHGNWTTVFKAPTLESARHAQGAFAQSFETAISMAE